MTRLMGIVNVTPDSFSDGGQCRSVEEVISHCKTLIENGADVIDIGAESTRPGATPLSEEEEWSRLEFVLPELLKEYPDCSFSLDSYHMETMKKALSLGVKWINYVLSNLNQSFIELVQRYPECKVILMHNLGIPASKTTVMHEKCDVIAEINLWFERTLMHIGQYISIDRVVIDPGIGFGKTASQSRCILENIGEFKQHNCPILVGHSRKSFLALPNDASIEDKDNVTCEISKVLADKGVDYLRVHNVSANKQAIML